MKIDFLERIRIKCSKHPQRVRLLNVLNNANITSEEACLIWIKSRKIFKLRNFGEKSFHLLCDALERPDLKPIKHIRTCPNCGFTSDNYKKTPQ